MPTNSDKFETWAIVELFGHQQIAGLASEATIGGCAFVRVDVPDIDDRPAFTRFYGNGAIYSLTPVSEEVGRLAAKSIRQRPVTVYLLPAVRSTDPEADRMDMPGYLHPSIEDDDAGEDGNEDGPGF